MLYMRIISFILHNFRKLMFWEFKQLAQDHVVSDREGLRSTSTWPKSPCAVHGTALTGETVDTQFSL